ncbi:hypothetical protein Y032_0322g2429 [Ancylostoma ceylanicum]|uniref:Uncharacterized protein n=1 Tax=Ancylostoma ceylanicum TaxID=53326 RepID=A0A016S0J9_9BILA|nr:hypothetical protein Y032_0322g2429 [Ancylostoma ceylanicum]
MKTGFKPSSLCLRVCVTVHSDIQLTAAVSHLRHTGRELAQILGRCTRRLPPFGDENTSAINEISGCVWRDN